jgi:hypothetical protein
MEGRLIEECLLEGRPIKDRPVEVGFIKDPSKEENPLEEPFSGRTLRIRLHRGIPYRGNHLE